VEAALGLVDVAVPDPPTAPPPAATVTPLVAEVKVTPVAVASKPEISEPLAEPEAVSMIPMQYISGLCLAGSSTRSREG
jgi:hypothetical protein